MIAEPLVLEFGVGLISYIVSGLETDYVNKQRMILVKKTGKLMPLLRIRDNTELKENEYRISAFDNVLFSAFIDENEEEVNTLRNGSLHPVMEYDLQDHV